MTMRQRSDGDAPRGKVAQRARRGAETFALTSARLAHEAHCTDVVVLDVHDISQVTDFFLICTGTSDRQMRTVAERIEQAAPATQHTLFRAAGLERAHWIVLDFIDVVVHLFDPEWRSRYDLELLWGDAPRVDWSRDGADDNSAATPQ